MESSTTNAAGRASLGRWVARILAVLAVGAAAVALYLVISGSDATDSGSKKAGKNPPSEQQQPERPPDTYVVQPGDTIGGIAVKLGVSVERIEELNPEIDAQALPSGAALLLRPEPQK
ncbi:MAG: LysM peptidoglycan-binding domain-containing protein [Solirubrobacterales bacterium]